MTDKQLINSIKAGDLKPVYLLTGEENYYIDTVSDWIEQNVVDPTLRDFDQTVVYGRDVKMNDVIGQAKRYPMMSPVHLVMVKEAQEIDTKQWALLADYLEKPMAQTMLVLCYRHKTLDKRTAAYKAIAKAGVVFETKHPYDSAIPGWIAAEASAHGHQISEQCAMMIAGQLGNDLGKLASELGKLYPLLKPGEPIDERLVEEQIGISREYNVFELQKAIGQRNPLVCNRIVNYMAANPKKNPIQLIVPSLYGWVLKVMFYHQVETKSEAAKVIGCPLSFVGEYAMAARNYSLAKLASCIGYLYDTDLRSKGLRNSGTVTDGELLKELVFKMIH